ncbi:sperm protamine P1 [Geobacillus kaustophilus HTA426]|uniref:Sperm protamine P1 n=1 Tax=Geobacillus kaustophilus (strain HTA426) TaxID=235909 RepID=Q5KZ62_GEOKA|nr:sperm protamine P1 [Geobacillus kaustophilus HTA426]
MAFGRHTITKHRSTEGRRGMMRNRWRPLRGMWRQERSSVGKTKPVVKHGRRDEYVRHRPITSPLFATRRRIY